MKNIALLSKEIGLIVAITFFTLTGKAQVITHEDSLAAGLSIKGNSATAISGYGEAFYNHDFKQETGTMQLKRVVLFVGHRFNNKISFFSELELEDAKVAGGQSSGEISMEQAFIKFDLNRSTYIQAGLFVPRIGIINENHLPTTFNGNERPVLETMLIPATWRELGVGLYGNVPSIPGLNYSLAILNGLNADGFSADNGISGGRSEGFQASARQKAITGALLYYSGPWRFQVSSYVGGSVGLDNKTADRLALSTGFFGTPVFFNEANIQFRKKGLTIKAIATMINIPDAGVINAAYANNTPEEMRGGYIDIAYDLLHKKYQGNKQFNIFSRYELVDMTAKMPANGILNPYYKQHHAFVGFTYMPVRGVAVKVDYHYVSNGSFNQAVIVNPSPYSLPYYTERSYLNTGLAYSF